MEDKTRNPKLEGRLATPALFRVSSFRKIAMTTHTSPLLDDYRYQLQRCAQALSLGHNEDVRPFLACGVRVEQVKLFTDGNLDKRFEKVRDQVELLKSAFDKLDELVSEYIREVPLAAYDTGCSDGDRFLKWLTLTHVTTPEQQDHITCQLARHEVEAIARKNRLGHVRFQELWSMASKLANDIESNTKLRILLNPIRTWATFQTNVLLGNDVQTPADVMFFACGSQIRTSVFEEIGKQHIATLASHGPLRLTDWIRHERSASRGDLIEFCLDAAEIGLLAFG